ncbi:ABC transporter substrate-binding protein [Mesorhizobium sp. WSM4887]|uniref:ABC transporter substrate-binding protein n=1 Tax=Mesorhizobium sp. WSM4887 TaxID=3038543 RepID=UPI0024178534|nr:ABC transporter substrate-binding protein [Mesorhizobium sp. WSM4887]MDG4889784.1 ABC transporter substrate-binding protein [Mesorhizobium sp. WSM4887]
MKGGVLVVARPADVVLWDPKFTSDNDSLWAQQQIFATLLQNSPDGKELQPSLAESYQISPDAKVFTFKLHDNAKFCDGSKITSADVKFSFERALEKDSNVSWAYPGNPKIETPDDLTVNITLDTPNVSFPAFLTLWGTAILSKTYAEKVGVQALSEKPLGSGPFCLETWDKGQQIVLKPNPGYWDPSKPYVDEVDMRVVQDDNARMLQIQSGDADIALTVPDSQADVLGKAEGVKVSQDILYGTAALVLNQHTVPAFTDLKVRQAMARALDRQAMVNSILFGRGEVAKSPFYGPGILYWTGEFEVKYDLEKAKQLIGESAFAKGFSIELTIPSGDTLASQTAVIVKDQLSKIGIDISITPVESGTWWQLWSTSKYQMLYKLGTNDVIDPAENISFDFWSTEEGGSDAAFSGYHNSKIVELSRQAQAELDSAKRAALYKDLQRIAMEEVPQMYLFHPANIWATRDNIHGFAIFPTKLHRFWEVWKSE